MAREGLVCQMFEHHWPPHTCAPSKEGRTPEVGPDCQCARCGAVGAFQRSQLQLILQS
jgi:hypothetical protein